ncbi:monooxygenase [Coprinopsis sp. MPI-PUGE-AT-0042]|nr:monooxygenase [Coprinopsis sp. MPI-PUGE-AT-0042]
MTRLLSALCFLALAFQGLISTVVSLPSTEGHSPHTRAKCTNLRLRKEWRDLSTAERVDYIRAVKCLQATPSKVTTHAGVKTRFDEFQACHIDLTDTVHQVGHFLAWHRQFMTMYATAMREECGYQGPATYWDWSRDADGWSILRSFDPVTGFGGDGVPGTYNPPNNPGNPTFPGIPRYARWYPRVASAPVRSTPVSSALGLVRPVGDHCLLRAVNDNMKSSVTSANVRAVLSRTTFESFRTSLENGGQGINGMGIHGGGHGVVGGEMMNPYSSPADEQIPLFYLHHGNLDRIWWKWQSADLTNRLWAISGPPLPRQSGNITLDFKMSFTTLGPQVAVRDVMDIESEPGCFRYND